MTLAAQLDAAIRVVCPITGVQVGNPADKATWSATYDNATDAQKAAAQAVIDGFAFIADATGDMNNADKMLKAVCLYFGNLLGKTPALIRAGIKAAYDALP